MDRRAASKVTIAYDASGLKEGVFIYLKSVQIKDIPVNCYLGKTNTPSENEQSSLIKDGEIIKYYTGTTPPAFDESYPVRLATGRAYYPCEEMELLNMDTKRQLMLCFSLRICRETSHMISARMQIKMENWIIPDYLLICNSRTKIIQNIGQR